MSHEAGNGGWAGALLPETVPLAVNDSRLLAVCRAVAEPEAAAEGLARVDRVEVPELLKLADGLAEPVTVAAGEPLAVGDLEPRALRLRPPL